MSASDLFIISLLGSLLALFLTAFAGVIAAAWFLHSAASSRANVRSFKDPLDAAIAEQGAVPGVPREVASMSQAEVERNFRLDGGYGVRASSPGRPRIAPEAPVRGSQALRSRPRCTFCQWLRRRFSTG